MCCSSWDRKESQHDSVVSVQLRCGMAVAQERDPPVAVAVNCDTPSTGETLSGRLRGGGEEGVENAHHCIDNARGFVYNALVFEKKRKNHDNFTYNSHG